MRHNTVYKISNKINKKFYIGAHSTDNLEDDYFGSGVILKRAINKYGIENFEKQILFDYNNREDMFNMEKMLVDSILINQLDCYNANIGGKGGSAKGSTISDEAKKNISKGLKGKISHRKGKTDIYSEETLKKMSKAQIGRKHSDKTRTKMRKSMKGSMAEKSRVAQAKRMKDPDHPAHAAAQTPEAKAKRAPKLSKALKGKPKTKEHKKNISRGKKGTIPWNKGKEHTEETKRKISEAAKRRWRKEKEDV